MTSSQAALLDKVESEIDALAEEVVAEIVTGISIYRPGGLVPREDLTHSVKGQLTQMISALRTPATPHDFSAARETGRRRAGQGAPLPEVTRAFRLCFEQLWRRLAAEIYRSPDPNTIELVLDTATRLWRLTDEFAVELTVAHRATAAAITGAQQRRRSALAQALFTGEPGPPRWSWETANLLGFPSDTEYVVVSAQAPAPGEEALPGIEINLAQRGFVSVWQLTPIRQNGIVALGGGRVDDLVVELEHVAVGRTGISPAYANLTDTPRALHLAGLAVSSLIYSTDTQVTVFGGSPLSGLVAHNVEESRRIAREVLGAVFDLPAPEREMLLQTFQTWFDTDCSTKRAAAALYCHANTVRNRLRRIEELTGRSFGKPWEAAELAVALESYRIARPG